MDILRPWARLHREERRARNWALVRRYWILACVTVWVGVFLTLMDGALTEWPGIVRAMCSPEEYAWSLDADALSWNLRAWWWLALGACAWLIHHVFPRGAVRVGDSMAP
jgi:hypothetical protein